MTELLFFLAFSFPPAARPTAPPPVVERLPIASLLTSYAGRGASDWPASWAELGFRHDSTKLTHGREVDLDVARIKSRVALFASGESTPLRRSGWETEDSLKSPLSGPFFLVGRVGANSESVEQQSYKLVGMTGLGLRLPIGGEIQMRGGRQMTNYDPDDLYLVPEQSRNFFELSTRWTLPGQLNLEYTREATPARSNLKRDIRLAIPLSD